MGPSCPWEGSSGKQTPGGDGSPGANSSTAGQMLLLRPVTCWGASSHAASKSKASGNSREQLIWRTCEELGMRALLPAGGGKGQLPRGRGHEELQARPPERSWPEGRELRAPGHSTHPARSLPLCPATAPLLLPLSSPGKGWGMMKALCHSPILRGPKRALLPLKLLSKASSKRRGEWF